MPLMEIENDRRPQECYNLQGIRDLWKKLYKSKLHNRHHRSIKDNNIQAENQDSNQVNGLKKVGKKGGREFTKKNQNCGNNNNIRHENNDYNCLKKIMLLNNNTPKKKQLTPNKETNPEDSARFEKKENTPSRETRTSFESKPSLGRSMSINNNKRQSQQWGKTPNNSRAASMNRTFSARNRANSFNNTKVNRSTSMNISRSRGDDDDDNNVVMTSFRSFNKTRSGHIIMFSSSSGVLKPPVMEEELQCTLEDLCFGCVKKIRVSRDVYSPMGKITQEEEVLTVNVKPGWKAGTKITFQGTTGTDETSSGGHRADVEFVVIEKPHGLFRRNGDDLEMEMQIPLVDALTGCTLTFTLLGGEKMTTAIDDVVFPGYEKILMGLGMPDQKNPHRRGDLRVKFIVDFPNSLSEERRKKVVRIFSDIDFAS